ncbi:MAG: hypothetical protein DRP91_04030 [Candidatus Neomarinimicrobiota bacterium]|nr:TetR/AcrR family transcriptional regulator [Candidatus Neomarinimicrobiota bacterium]RKY49542.1 MAG: hypothetical protein DRP91_04030 [Candidatus Neomarinimicrobiota bacterium]RKY53411.1 MAG: hypothetical protein DRP92_03560 [Candidatus Neomarinimicrobiota bacterium]
MENVCCTKDRIIDIAIEMFAKKGYENVSMNEIAKEVGISKPAIYYYFESKEKLFIEMMNVVTEKFLNSIEEVFEKDVPPEQKLLNMIETMFEKTKEKPKIFRIIHGLNIEDTKAEFVLKFKDRFRFIRENLRKIIIEGKNSGKFRQDIDPEVFIPCFNGSISLHVIRYIKGDDIDLSRERARKVWDLFLKGLLTKQEE